MAETEAGNDSWTFHEEGDDATEAPLAQSKPVDNQPISWTASEYISHEKSLGWYLGLAATTVIVAVITYFISHGDVLSVGVMFVAGILFGVLAGRAPRELAYTVDGQGITIGDRLYPYSLFKSFSVHYDGPLTSINLFPLKRLMPDVSIYLPPEEQNKILDRLADYLPNDQRPEHIIDRLMKRVRF